MHTKGASQRTFTRGTAKRLSRRYAKPRPVGRAPWLGLGSENFAVFYGDRSRCYAKSVGRSIRVRFPWLELLEQNSVERQLGEQLREQRV